MTQIFHAFIAGVLALALLADAALAQKRATGNLAAIQLECFKAQGAYLDPVTKQYMIQGTEMDMLSRTDAVRKCVAEKSGGQQMQIRETPKY